MKSQNVRIVYVDEYHSHPLAISSSAYEQITAIVQANRVCQSCAALYTESNPMVIRNTCLHCFMQSEVVRREKPLTFIGAFGEDTSGDMRYKFLDSDGYVYLVDCGSDYNSLKRNILATLAH